MIHRPAYLIIAFVMICLMGGLAIPAVTTSRGQTVYVSAYPNVFMGPRGNNFDLTINLVIRNVDLKLPISVTSVDYYNTMGALTKKYLRSSLTLNPLESTHILITEKNTTGGIGSNFIVRWKADKEVNVPIIEAVMIGGKSGQGISFVTSGREISE